MLSQEKRRISFFSFPHRAREIPAGNRCEIRILMEQPRIERFPVGRRLMASVSNFATPRSKINPPPPLPLPLREKREADNLISREKYEIAF